MRDRSRAGPFAPLHARVHQRGPADRRRHRPPLSHAVAWVGGGAALSTHAAPRHQRRHPQIQTPERLALAPRRGGCPEGERSRAGHPEEARAAWWRALEILSDFGHRDAERLRAKLRRSGGPPSPGSKDRYQAQAER